MPIDNDTRCYTETLVIAIMIEGSPSLLGIAEFIVQTGSFFHAQTHLSFHIIEELSPNVRMSHDRRPLATGEK